MDSVTSLGFHIPELLMPAHGIHLETWCVVACDQYSAEPEYWQEVMKYVDGQASTLQAIYPEAFLGAIDHHQRIINIHHTMNRWLNDGTLKPLSDGLMTVERTMPDGNIRRGILLALDLEYYDYQRESTSLIRPTEGTIVDRLPPRVLIREKAPVEFPHIMVLIDDPDQQVIEPLFGMPNTPKYATPLMMQGGHVSGRIVDRDLALSHLNVTLGNLLHKAKASSPQRPLYAVGDGNHSLAAAKSIWESHKAAHPDSLNNNLALRYAMVEVVNLHDRGLDFKAIHRLIQGMNAHELLTQLQNWCTTQSIQLHHKTLSGLEGAIAWVEEDDGSSLRFVMMDQSVTIAFAVHESAYRLSVELLQSFLDHLTNHRAIDVEYIHGDATLYTLSQKTGHSGILLPALSRHHLFPAISQHGPLPRKAFSMGEAHEKRYYLEGRSLAIV